MQFNSILIICLLHIGQVDCQTNCFECVDMPHPSDCEFATRCSASEQCFVEQIITSGGLVLYNSGCKAKTRCSATGKRHIYSRSAVQKRDDVTVCQECCSGDFCNDNGCGELAQRFPQRALKCYHCKDSIDLNDCRDLTICQDQSEVCQALANLHNNNNVCVYCCDSDFCNNKCNGTSGGTGSSGVAITGIPGNTPSTSARTTQSTMKTTTTRPTTTTIKVSPQVFCQQNNYLFFGFIPFCFKVHQELKTRSEAQTFCQSEQGQLAVIDSKTKWDFITKVYSQLVFNGPREFYVDGVYDTIGSSFKCQNNSACSFAQWGTSQPDNPSSKQCLYLNGTDSMKWYNADCSERKKFICTKAI